MPDHIHLLVSLHSTIAISKIVNVLKSNSSRWIHENIPTAQSFRWQQRYGAFSVSKSGEDRLSQYIQGQKQHHRERSFQEEYLALLVRHGIKYDEKYLWG